jgi:hypothetical protein
MNFEQEFFTRFMEFNIFSVHKMDNKLLNLHVLSIFFYVELSSIIICKSKSIIV